MVTPRARDGTSKGIESSQSAAMHSSSSSTVDSKQTTSEEEEEEEEDPARSETLTTTLAEVRLEDDDEVEEEVEGADERRSSHETLASRASEFTADDDDLASFRRAWKEEVRQRTKGGSCAPPLEAKAGREDIRGDIVNTSNGKDTDAEISGRSPTTRSSAGSLEDVATTSPNVPVQNLARSTAQSMMRPVSVNDISKRRPLTNNTTAESGSGTSGKGSGKADGNVIESVPQNTVEEAQEFVETDTQGAPLRLMRRAVIAYASAVGLEREGELDEALIHYRKAFKLDPEVDTLFGRASRALQAEIESSQQGSGSLPPRRELLIESEDVRQSICSALNVEDYRYVAIRERQQSGSIPASVPDATPVAQKGRESSKVDDSRTVATSKQRQASMSEHETQSHPVRITQHRDILASLIKSLSLEAGGERDFSKTKFFREDEEAPAHIASLPDELLLVILAHVASPRGQRGAEIRKTNTANSGDSQIQSQHTRKSGATQHMSSNQSQSQSQTEKNAHLGGIGVILAGPDYMSIEQLGRTCWKFRLLTKAWSVWKLIVNETYYPPQIDSRAALPSLVQKHYIDWRTAFVEQPRVRLNGAYIAAYHYTRPGVHEENVWVNVVHVVEFYRSLRFLPDGRLLSLLTTDPPNETVRRMEPSLRIKGFAIGRWKLFANGLDDDADSGRPAGPKVLIDDLHDKTLAGYSFRILLKLDKTGRGKWNRMDMLEFESVNHRTGEICPLPMNHKKPFHFSTVRSYGI